MAESCAIEILESDYEQKITQADLAPINATVAPVVTGMDIVI